MDVRSEIFEEDPCPGTGKYIEAQYNCLGWCTIFFSIDPGGRASNGMPRVEAPARFGSTLFPRLPIGVRRNKTGDRGHGKQRTVGSASALGKAWIHEPKWLVAAAKACEFRGKSLFRATLPSPRNYADDR